MLAHANTPPWPWWWCRHVPRYTYRQKSACSLSRLSAQPRLIGADEDGGWVRLKRGERSRSLRLWANVHRSGGASQNPKIPRVVSIARSLLRNVQYFANPKSSRDSWKRVLSRSAFGSPLLVLIPPLRSRCTPDFVAWCLQLGALRCAVLLRSHGFHLSRFT